MANAIICDALKKAGFPAVLEPTGLVRGDGKRPDGATTIPWKRGRLMTWDFTCTDTFCQTNIHSTSSEAGAAAEAAEELKCKKYVDSKSYDFIPVAVETSGVLVPQASSFLKDLGRRIIQKTRDLRESSFLKQRLDIAICRGNALSIKGCYTDRTVQDMFPSVVKAVAGQGDPGVGVVS